MIIIRGVVVSEEIFQNFFVCDLHRCKGACCVEGDLGAPLETGELKRIRESLDRVSPYLSEESRRILKNQGPYLRDFEGDYSTPTIGGKECVYGVYDENGILKCGFELAWKDGQSDFRKPVSCHLYPIRVKKNFLGSLVRYDRWEICSPACKLGQDMKVPLYVFLKDALVRKFGEDWYRELEKIAGEKKSGN